jgi:hypothetical protein
MSKVKFNVSHKVTKNTKRYLSTANFLAAFVALWEIILFKTGFSKIAASNQQCKIKFCPFWQLFGKNKKQ